MVERRSGCFSRAARLRGERCIEESIAIFRRSFIRDTRHSCTSREMLRVVASHQGRRVQPPARDTPTSRSWNSEPGPTTAIPRMHLLTAAMEGSLGSEGMLVRFFEAVRRSIATAWCGCIAVPWRRLKPSSRAPRAKATHISGCVSTKTRTRPDLWAEGGGRRKGKRGR